MWDNNRNHTKRAFVLVYRAVYPTHGAHRPTHLYPIIVSHQSICNVCHFTRTKPNSPLKTSITHNSIDRSIYCWYFVNFWLLSQIDLAEHLFTVNIYKLIGAKLNEATHSCYIIMVPGSKNNSMDVILESVEL